MSLSKLRQKLEQKKEVMPIEKLFANDFNKALLQIENERKQGKPDGYYRPSSLGGGCVRKLFFEQMNAPQDPINLKDEWTYNLIGITENGTDRHTRIQDVIFKMEDMGLHLENLDVEEIVREANQKGIKTKFIEWDEERKEARCANDELKIWFKADGLFKYRGKEVLFEIKTANGFKFQKIVKSNEPLPEHIEQDTCYAMGLGIDFVLYLYEDRNFMKKHFILYRITEEDKQKIKDRIELVEEHVVTRFVPEKEEDKCTYCNFKDECAKWEKGDFYKSSDEEGV